LITSKSTDNSFIRYLINVRAPTPFVCPCSRFLSIPACHYGYFYFLLRKGKPKIHILDCCSFVSYFPFWQEFLLIPNSTSSETVHQHRRQAAASKLPPPSCRRQAAASKLPPPSCRRQAAAARGSSGKNVIFSNRPYDQSKYSDPLIYVPI
jgi:hypothetical protein